MLKQNVPRERQWAPPALKVLPRSQGPIVLSSKVKIPTFHHELSPARYKERMAWSLVLHVLGLLVLVKLAEWLPMPRVVEISTVTATPLYLLPKVQPPPVVVHKIQAPPVQTLAKITPPKIQPPPLPVEKPPIPEPEPKPQPKIETPAETFASAPAVKPEPPKKEIITNTFASGSSVPPTEHKSERQVQTGGFGDPNGVPGTSDAKRTLTIANVGSFDLPSGAGKGNGTGGTHGTPGTVASAGFGDGIAGPGNGDHPKGAVTSAGFSNLNVAPTKTRSETKPESTPVEILYKPKPVYTAEARQLRIQGEVLVEVMFSASGDLRINRVTRGLGHGLDEAALHAAQLIKFRPAIRDGHPYDSNGIVHIIFELAE